MSKPVFLFKAIEIEEIWNGHHTKQRQERRTGGFELAKPLLG